MYVEMKMNWNGIKKGERGTTPFVPFRKRDDLPFRFVKVKFQNRETELDIPSILLKVIDRNLANDEKAYTNYVAETINVSEQVENADMVVILYDFFNAAYAYVAFDRGADIADICNFIERDESLNMSDIALRVADEIKREYIIIEKDRNVECHYTIKVMNHVNKHVETLNGRIVDDVYLALSFILDRMNK